MSAALKRARLPVVAAQSASMGVAVPRRFASAAYAHMKVKKNNWVEQNEIARENKFYQWTINKKNIFGLLVMTVLFPGFYHYLHKDEQQRRDEKVRGIKAREYY